MFHAACVPIAHTSALRQGALSVVMRRFELEPFLANIEKFGVNEIGIVPPIVIAIIMSGLGKKYSLASLKNITVGAAPLGKASQDRLRALLGKNATVNQVWGMTEMSCVATMFHYPLDDTSGSIGHFLPNCDAKYLPLSASSNLSLMGVGLLTMTAKTSLDLMFAASYALEVR